MKPIETRSKFEAKIVRELRKDGETFRYEPKDQVLGYEKPATKHKYLPDFELDNGILVEAKGKLDLDTRKKMVLVRDQNPNKDIRFVFMRANNTLTKKSKTTYGKWATKNGFKWADGSIPKEWYSEKKSVQKGTRTRRKG